MAQTGIYSSSWGTFEIASYLIISGVRKQPSSSLVELPTQEDIKYLCLSKHIWTIHNTCTIVHICTYLKDSPCDKNKIVIACNCYINVINWYMMFPLYQNSISVHCNLISVGPSTDPIALIAPGLESWNHHCRWSKDWGRRGPLNSNS